MIPENTRQWADRVARCATSCAATIAARKIKANEAPLVIGALVRGLADHVGIPVEIVLEMVKQAAVAKELPEISPQIEVPPHLFPDLLKRQSSQIANLAGALGRALDALKAARECGCEISLDRQIAEAERSLSSFEPPACGESKEVEAARLPSCRFLHEHPHANAAHQIKDWTIRSNDTTLHHCSCGAIWEEQPYLQLVSDTPKKMEVPS